MVETVQAIENIEGISSVKGLDGIFIGSGDLKLSIKAQFGEHKQDVFEKSVDAPVGLIADAR